MTGSITEDQSASLAFLADPAAYGLPAGEPVRRIDTHASHVFLSGDRAWKMKRAVRYPYLDYGTAERRRWACEQEVALNRRTAPTLYLGVGVIRRRGGGLVLDPGGEGEGEAVEWLVMMRRFGDEALLDRMAETGRLTPDLMRRAAAAIAAFHGCAEPAPHGAGSAEMRAVIDENAAEFRGRPDLFDPESVAAIDARSREALDRLSPLLDRRRDTGLVRRCHGDLHLRNLCLVDGEPTPFDCIEFSDDFTCIDVLYDLAYLLMDLLHRDRVDLANIVLNEYAKNGQDLDGLATLTLFMATRAAIRAKVTGSAVVLGAVDPAQRRDIGVYLALAQSLLRQQRPLLIAIGGLPGTGKTTVARRVAPWLGGAVGALHWRSDVVRKQLAGVDELVRLPTESYTREASASVYGEMLRRARETLRAGQPAIVDAVFLAAGERAAAEAVAAEEGAGFAGFWLEACDAELRRRLAARTGDASDATPVVLDLMQQVGAGTIAWQRLDASRADVPSQLRACLSSPR